MPAPARTPPLRAGAPEIAGRRPRKFWPAALGGTPRKKRRGLKGTPAESRAFSARAKRWERPAFFLMQAQFRTRRKPARYFFMKNKLKQDCSTRDMATDLADVMNQLNITKAFVLGVSQGGMIAQYLAIDYPELVEKLVLAVTLCQPNETSKSVISNWLLLAKEKDFKQIFIDTAEKTYTERKLKTYRPFYSILSKLTEPKNLDRFIIQATACLTHNALDEISKIQCPTFVIGGDNDKIVGSSSSCELANHIAQSKLKIYNGLGHSTYEEAKDFNSQVLSFFDN